MRKRPNGRVGIENNVEHERVELRTMLNERGWRTREVGSANLDVMRITSKIKVKKRVKLRFFKKWGRRLYMEKKMRD